MLLSFLALPAHAYAQLYGSLQGTGNAGGTLHMTASGLTATVTASGLSNTNVVLSLWSGNYTYGGTYQAGTLHYYTSNTGRLIGFTHNSSTIRNSAGDPITGLVGPAGTFTSTPPNSLTIKATLSNTQEKQVKVEALIRELNNQKAMGVVPPTASTSWKDVQTTSGALDGSLQSKMVDLLIDGRKVAERPTPSSFAGNYVVDFGKIELVGDCKTCTTGFCIAGHMEAKLGN